MAIQEDLVAIIMAGGAGTRFWPLSTEEKPKQFLKLFGQRSMLQMSLDRVLGLVPAERTLVLTNRTLVDKVREQLPELPPENIIGEPIRRDTAAAVCLGAVLCRRRYGNPVIVTLTADHRIEPVETFQKTLLSAVRQARKTPALYTFGIRPTYPATGYGYLELGEKTADEDGIEHFRLVRFKEKPDMETAERYIGSGRFLWNSGMFVWSADVILREIERVIPAHLARISRAVEFDLTPGWPEALENAFKALEPISIDFAVMEKAQEVRCVCCGFSWSDVGGWNALKDFVPRDGDGNSANCRVISSGAQNNLVFCDGPDETVMLIGVEDLIVVRCGDKTLITHKNGEEEIKRLVKEKLIRS